MSRDNPLMLDAPYLTFLAHFWSCLRDDLHLRGCTSDSGLPASSRRLSYQERVNIEREMLKEEAEAFLETDDFRHWAISSGLDPVTLKENLTDVHY